MHKRRYDRRTLQSLLLRSGFEIEFLSYYNALLFPAAAAVRLLSRCLHTDRESSLENGFRDSPVNRLLFRIFRLEKGVLGRGRTFPFGLSLIAVVRRPE